MENKKEIIIAGGGHGGFAVAGHLAKMGYDVTIYEKNKREDMGYDWTDIQNILVKLSQLGAKKVVLKGVEFQHEPAEIPSCKGKIGIVSYDSTTNMFDYYFHEKQPRSFVGTGDIFASILTGAIVRGISLKDSYTLAGDFIVEAIKATIKRENSNWYGVDFETAIPYLVNRLQNMIK